MKPKQLRSPFSWEERRIAIHDRVWYVPEYYEDYRAFTFPGWEHPDLFGNSNPVHVEYCSGNGLWIAERAISEKQINWVAVEKKFERVRKIWSKIKNHDLSNLLVVCGEGGKVTSHYFPNDSIAAAYINFPDPWPKTRHAKHRILQRPFIEELYRSLQPDACMTLVTDDAEYSDWVVQNLQEHGKFRSCFGQPFYVTDQSEYGTSYFDQLWRSIGRTIRYHRFRK